MHKPGTTEMRREIGRFFAASITVRVPSDFFCTVMISTLQITCVVLYRQHRYAY